MAEVHPAEEARWAESLRDLTEAWQSAPLYSAKETPYFPAYVKLFDHLRGTDCTFIEVGIQGGGSLFMWRTWLGERARIVGVDLNPECLELQQHGFEIHIGDQGDPEFWRSFYAEVGPFDALLDDGGHQSFQQALTVAEALRAAKTRAVVAVEDTATSFMHDFSRHGSRTFLEYAKDSTDVLVGRSFGLYPGRFPRVANSEILDQFQYVESIEFFTGLVAFKVNPETPKDPEVVTNRKAPPLSDFRYDGRNSARILWPSLWSAREVRISGGRSLKSNAKRAVRSVAGKARRH